jgi:hypothetical protein
MITPATPPVNCPVCGKPLSTGANCPNCRLSCAADREVIAARSQATEPPPVPSQSPPFQFGLSSLLLITTLAAVVMSVSVMLPGLGIALAVISVPALVRTYVLVRGSRADGKPASAQEKVVLFLTCLGIAAIIAIVTGAAFFVTCLVGFIGTSAASGGVPSSLDKSLTIGVVLGAGVGIPLLVVLLRWWFRQAGGFAKRPDYFPPPERKP